jgi:hypothetical protein
LRGFSQLQSVLRLFVFVALRLALCGCDSISCGSISFAAIQSIAAVHHLRLLNQLRKCLFLFAFVAPLRLAFCGCDSINCGSTSFAASQSIAAVHHLAIQSIAAVHHLW